MNRNLNIVLRGGYLDGRIVSVSMLCKEVVLPSTYMQRERYVRTDAIERVYVSDGLCNTLRVYAYDPV